MTFEKSSISEYELTRFSWADNIKVIGGAQKLFKYFIAKYETTKVVTYYDLSKFTGKTYIKLRFKATKEDITSPD